MHRQYLYAGERMSALVFGKGLSAAFKMVNSLFFAILFFSFMTQSAIGTVLPDSFKKGVHNLTTTINAPENAKSSLRDLVFSSHHYITHIVNTATRKGFKELYVVGLDTFFYPGVQLWRGPSFEELLVPLGLLLILFGTFTLRHVLIICCYVQHGMVIGILSALLLHICYGKCNGVIMGYCIAATLPISNLHFVAMFVFAVTFGISYNQAPVHASMVTTSYLGTFLMFYGTAVLDRAFRFLSSASFDFNLNVSHFNLYEIMHVPGLTLSVVNFLLIGYLGIVVQTILLSLIQQQRHSSIHRQYMSIAQQFQGTLPG